jgi:hypothetical protein
MWSTDGKEVMDHIAGFEGAQLAMATYRATSERCSGKVITHGRARR